MAKEEEVKTPTPIEPTEEVIQEVENAVEEHAETATSVDAMIEEAPATTSNETQEYLRNLIKNATK
nr:MAG TPA: hypothetical protein [Caudoviricetes sp.]